MYRLPRGPVYLPSRSPNSLLGYFAKRGPFGEPFGSFLVGPNATLEVKLQPVLFP